MSTAHEDHWELPGELSRLAEMYLGGARGQQGGSQFRPLREGSFAVIMLPVGSFVHGARGTGQDYVTPWGMELVPGSAPGPGVSHRDMLGDDTAGLSYALRPVWYRASNPRGASVDLLRDRAMAVGDRPPIVPKAWPVPREVLDRQGAREFARSVMRAVRATEDELCLEMLESLPSHDSELEHGGGLTVGGLLDHLADMNAGRPPGSQLDTIFLSTANFLRLAAGREGRPGASTPYSNVLEVDGCTVIAHKRIPGEAAYFTSRTHGPALVRCPTAIRCGESKLLVEHYCAKHMREGAVAGLPGGFAVRLVRAAAGGPARLAERGSSLLEAGRKMIGAGEYDCARVVLERAPRAGDAGVAACLLWDTALEALGAAGDELIASNNDLLVSVDDLARSGLGGDDLLRARRRTLRRLGLA